MQNLTSRKTEKADFPEFEIGDILCVGSKTLLSKLIRWFTTVGAETESICSHVGVMVSPTDICEALTKVKIHNLAENYAGLSDGKIWLQMWRKKVLSDNQQTCMVNKCQEYEGRTYGYVKIAAHAVDGILSKMMLHEVYLFRKLMCMDKYPICSWVNAFVYEHCVITNAFGIAPSLATPDDIHDYLLGSADYEMVWSFGSPLGD